MDQAPVSRSELLRGGLSNLLKRVRRALPFALGVFAALLAILLYNLLTPRPHELTIQEVQASVAETMASATPPPAYATAVYQIIRPSLVLVQTKSSGADGKEKDGLGSGVIVDTSGDILTSLHVIANTSDIQLFFYDGTQSGAQVVTTQPENDIAVLRADHPPAQLVPAVLGNPNAMQIGDDVYAAAIAFCHRRIEIAALGHYRNFGLEPVGAHGRLSPLDFQALVGDYFIENIGHYFESSTNVIRS
jgi:hypothetical protein